MERGQSPSTAIGPVGPDSADGGNRTSARGIARRTRPTAWLLPALAAVGLAAVALVAAGCSAGGSVGAIDRASLMGTQARGEFHDVDGAASGSAALEREVDGSFAIRLQDLHVATRVDMHVLVVPTPDVSRDQHVDVAASVDLGPLKASGGMQDYWLPSAAVPGTSSDATVVLWDVALGQAVAAAPLVEHALDR